MLRQTDGSTCQTVWLRPHETVDTNAWLCTVAILCLVGEHNMCSCLYLHVHDGLKSDNRFKQVLTQYDTQQSMSPIARMLLTSLPQFHQASAFSLLLWAWKCGGDDDSGDTKRQSHHVHGRSLGACHRPVSTGLRAEQRYSCMHVLLFLLISSFKTVWLSQCNI